MKKLLSGNEAIALGAYHAGVQVATAYPGTPSTEILETLASYEGLYVEWSTNEKVAMEVAAGAAFGGARAMVSMKMVGLNVAADPFMAAVYTGMRGALVVVSADDPGIHSSQNEQDNRHYAVMAKVPMLEPSDSQEAYELVDWAFRMSRQFDTPVLLRTTTRTSHGRSVVDFEPRERVPVALAPLTREPTKYVMIPAHARKRHEVIERRLVELAEFSESFPYNRMEPGDRKVGIVASGIGYQYAREVFPEASFLKLTMTHPFPKRLVQEFAREVGAHGRAPLLVVEELDPFLEERIRALGIPVVGKEAFPPTGEFNTDVVEAGARKLGLLPASPEPVPTPPLPARPPCLCPGCPHTAVFYLLRRLGFFHSPPTELPAERSALGNLQRVGLVIAGDIGCYTLSVLPPLLAMDTQGCMGASIGNAHGLSKAGIPNKVVAVLGDSTFVHSGIPSLIDVVYNRGSITTIVLDNGSTAMTGHQGHPGTGVTIRGETTHALDYAQLARAVGVPEVYEVDAFDVPTLESTLRHCVESNVPSLLIVKGPCPVHKRLTGEALVVDRETCDGCGSCIRLGCPALALEDGHARVESPLCIGAQCGLCEKVCPQDAISALVRDGHA
ncbi:MAG: indolepyruvate ferredoxin oxidoreductase subunit alpha [Chloroflexi bacterium]|nr:indolepyruvate ferredoxin oxidoreductase subunit alpha [Chloroflexota bacterium]